MKAQRAVLYAMGALLLAPIAPANASTTGGTAADTVEQLERRGYHVQINGGPSQGTLAQCTVTGVHGLRNSNVDDSGRRIDATGFDTVHVDVACNDTT